MKKKTIQENPFLDSRQTLEFLQISRMNLNRLKDKGILVAYKLGGKLYFKRLQLIEAIENGKVENKQKSAA